MVIIAVRTHLYPYRTQKLSSQTPTILHGRLCEKIGSCHLQVKDYPFRIVLFIFYANIYNKKEPISRSFFCYVPVLWYFFSAHRKNSAQGIMNSAPIRGESAYTICGKLPQPIMYDSGR